jgi:hypothetical protein
MKTAHNSGLFSVAGFLSAERYSFRKTFILADNNKLVLPQRLQVRKTLPIAAPRLQTGIVRSLFTFNLT